MKKNLIYISAVCALLCSCSNTDNPADNKDNGITKALSVSSTSMDAFATRAVTELNTDGAAIGMFLKDDATSGYVAAGNSNVQYIYTAANTPKWGGATTADVIYLNNNDAQVCAYYPYAGTVTDATAVALISQENLLDGSKDLSYSIYNSGTLNNTNNEIALTMNHAYAKITFSITRDQSYAGTCAITNVKLEDATNPDSKIIASSFLNITDANYAAVGSDPLTEAILGAVNFSVDATTAVYDGIADATTPTPEDVSVLMVPVAALDDLTKISFTVDSNLMSTTLDTSAATGTLKALAAGTNYKINVTIKGKGLQITTVEITDWVDDTSLATPLEPVIE